MAPDFSAPWSSRFIGKMILHYPFLSVCTFAYACVCVHSGTTCMHMHMHVYEGQRSMLGVFLNCTPLYFEAESLLEAGTYWSG